MSVCYGWVSLSLLLVSLDLYYKDYNKIKTSCYYHIAIYYITQQKLLYTIERLENIVSVILIYLIKSLMKNRDDVLVCSIFIMMVLYAPDGYGIV